MGRLQRSNQKGLEMKRSFTVIRGGRYNDVKGIEENTTARTRYADQKSFLASCKASGGADQPSWDSEVQINRMLSGVR